MKPKASRIEHWIESPESLTRDGIICQSKAEFRGGFGGGKPQSERFAAFLDN